MKKVGREVYVWCKYHFFVVPVPVLRREVVALAQRRIFD